MKIIIGSDHGGFKVKEAVKKHLNSKNIAIEDVGAYSESSCDYPDYASDVARKVLADKKSLGIIVCGTGIGVCITANKFKGIRAALCHDKFSAKMAREHNDANILCMGGRVIKPIIAKKIADIFVSTQFSNEERHKKRIAKISGIEKDNFK